MSTWTCGSLLLCSGLCRLLRCVMIRCWNVHPRRSSARRRTHVAPAMACSTRRGLIDERHLHVVGELLGQAGRQLEAAEATAEDHHRGSDEHTFPFERRSAHAAERVSRPGNYCGWGTMRV